MDQKHLTSLRSRLNSQKFRDRRALLSVVAGSMRIKIATLLYIEKRGLTVTELAEVLGVSVSRISHQISILRRHELVSVHPDGRRVVYRLRLNYLLRRLVGAGIA